MTSTPPSTNRSFWQLVYRDHSWFWKGAIWLILIGGPAALAWFYFVRDNSIWAQQHQIAVILPLSGPDSVSGLQLKAAIEFAEQQHCQENREFCEHVRVVFKDDRGDVETAKAAAQAAADEDNVIAVIGHFSSAITAATIPVYCQANMPIIMPVPTATGISALARNRGCTSALRLPPTNQHQGRRLARLMYHLQDLDNEIARQSAPDNSGVARGIARQYIALFRDQTNPDYSNNLGREFASAVASDKSAPYRIALDIAIGGDRATLTVTDSFKQASGVGIWVIAGMTQSALQTLRQAQILDVHPRYVVFTDGAVSEQLFIEGEDILKGNVYLLFQTPPDSPLLRKVLKVAGTDGSELSFAPYGYDAYILLTMLIEKISPSGAHVDRDDLREAITAMLNSQSSDGTSRFTLDAPKTMLGTFQFDYLGDNYSSDYTFYRLDSDKMRFVRDNGA